MTSDERGLYAAARSLLSPVHALAVSGLCALGGMVMRTLLFHIREQPFLAAVSAAAVIHSSWSLSTYFTGPEPHPQLSPAWFAWILPGLLLAFSVDVGLLSLAHAIRSGQRAIAKLIPFFVLSVAMAFSQFLYIAAHLPTVALANGVRAEWRPLVELIRDSSVWILPALLPTALTLYAFADIKRRPEGASVNAPMTESAVVPVEQQGSLVARCPECGWTREYATPEKARQGLWAHGRHCPHVQVIVPEEVDA